MIAPLAPRATAAVESSSPQGALIASSNHDHVVMLDSVNSFDLRVEGILENLIAVYELNCVGVARDDRVLGMDWPDVLSHDLTV